MSFRELRSFTEIMRYLGYPRLISVENFRTPNFELVADVLYWMVQRYDPHLALSDSIQTEDDRVEFLTGISQVLAARARIKLNTRRLYAADGFAVKELLKVARLLYEAAKNAERGEYREDARGANADSGTGSAASATDAGAPGTGTGAGAGNSGAVVPASSTVRVQDVKAARVLASEITESGARLYDLLASEHENRQARVRALRFLDTVSGSLDNTREHGMIERRVRELIEESKQNLESLQKQVADLESDDRALTTKIEKKQADLERAEKRLKSLQNVRPAFMDEYENLERELQRVYAIYVEKFRNLDYLERELDQLNKAEHERHSDSERQLKRMQKRLREEELRLLRGEADGAAPAQSGTAIAGDMLDEDDDDISDDDDGSDEDEPSDDDISDDEDDEPSSDDDDLLSDGSRDDDGEPSDISQESSVDDDF